MKFRRLAILGSISHLALASALLAQDVVELDPINVSLIEEGQENIEATGGAVVTEEDIEALQPADLSDVFSRESAVTVAGGSGPAKRIHVFGIEQSKLAVSVDGVPQPGTTWHHTGSLAIDPAFLKSVEVEAGAASADAGFAAGAGAIRYETVNAYDLLRDGRSSGGRASLSWGDNGRGFSGSLAGFGAHAGFDWLVMVHGQQGDNYENGEGYEMPGSEPAAQGFLAKLGYEFESHRIELSYDHSNDDADRVIKMNMDLNHDDAVYPLKVTRDTIKFKYTTTAPTDMWDPEVMFYASEYGYDRPDYAPGTTNGDMVLETTTFGGVAKNTFTVNSGTVVVGVDFGYNDYSIDNYGDASPEHQTMETMQVGLFAQGRFDFGNGVDLSTGLRLDHHRLTDVDGVRFEGGGASANATLAYEFAPGFEVFAGASRTWLGYDISEYGLVHAADYSFDPGYEPATATNFKAGFNASGGNWSGGITYFDTKLDKTAAYLRSGPTGTVENGGEARSKGVTLNGSYRWDTGRVGMTYTKADVTSEGEFALPDGSEVMPIGDMATLYVDQDIPNLNMRVGATVEWAGKVSDDAMTGAGFEDHDSYTVVNAYAEWTPERWDNAKLRLAVDNLFDETYYERSSYIRRTRGMNEIYPAYAPGRTVSLGLALDF